MTECQASEVVKLLLVEFEDFRNDSHRFNGALRTRKNKSVLDENTVPDLPGFCCFSHQKCTKSRDSNGSHQQGPVLHHRPYSVCSSHLLPLGGIDHEDMSSLPDDNINSRLTRSIIPTTCGIT